MELRKLLVGHDLNELEEAYMTSVDYDADEVRNLINKGFERFINKKSTKPAIISNANPYFSTFYNSVHFVSKQ